MLPRKTGNNESEWSETMTDEANESLPFEEEDIAPEEIALHVINPMDENPESEAQHTEPSDSIPWNIRSDEPNANYEAKDCLHSSCHCKVLQNEFCSKECDNARANESQHCNCSHQGCNYEEDELIGLKEIQGQF